MSEVKINVEGKVAFISGANRGIGKAIAIALLENGAKKVYAGARDKSSLFDLVEQYGDRVVAIQLDVTDNASIENAARIATDTELLFNNAGVLHGGGFIHPEAVAGLQTNLDVNVIGLVRLTNAFADTIKKQEVGAIVNVSSVVGLASMPVIGTYSASKALVHSITQSIRGELSETNILVAGVYPGPIDTDMAKEIEMEKDSPQNVARNIIEALKEGVQDIFPDVMSVQVGAGYANSPKAIEQQFGAFVG